MDSVFARLQLEKHGWSEGSGLGRKEAGITEALKVKYKFDTTGVGHDAGEGFTHHWWDEMFNRAASNIHVAEDGVTLKQDTAFNISRKKSRVAAAEAGGLLYGRFIKSSTLHDGRLEPEASTEGRDSSSSEDEASSPGQPFGGLSDEQLLKVCGGRTAHKGARHGLKLSGKLVRIQQQEAQALATDWPLAMPTVIHLDTPSVTPVDTPLTSPTASDSEGLSERRKDKKVKKVKQVKKVVIHLDTPSVTPVDTPLTSPTASDSEGLSERRKDKKVKKLKQVRKVIGTISECNVDTNSPAHQASSDATLVATLPVMHTRSGSEVVYATKEWRKLKKAKRAREAALEAQSSLLIPCTSQCNLAKSDSTTLSLGFLQSSDNGICVGVTEHGKDADGVDERKRRKKERRENRKRYARGKMTSEGGNRYIPAVISGDLSMVRQGDRAEKVPALVQNVTESAEMRKLEKRRKKEKKQDNSKSTETNIVRSDVLMEINETEVCQTSSKKKRKSDAVLVSNGLVIEMKTRKKVKKNKN